MTQLQNVELGNKYLNLKKKELFDAGSISIQDLETIVRLMSEIRYGKLVSLQFT